MAQRRVSVQMVNPLHVLRKAAHLATFRQFQESGPDAATADPDEVRREGAKPDGVIPVGASFSGGTSRSPAHPNCRCSVAYVTTDKGRDIAERLNERNKAETVVARAEAARRKSIP